MISRITKPNLLCKLYSWFIRACNSSALLLYTIVFPKTSLSGWSTPYSHYVYRREQVAQWRSVRRYNNISSPVGAQTRKWRPGIGIQTDRASRARLTIARSRSGPASADTYVSIRHAIPRNRECTVSSLAFRAFSLSINGSSWP